MKWIFAAIITGASLASFPALSQSSHSDREGTELSVRIFVKCAGLYEWSSEFLRSAGKPSSADYMHNMHNGAVTTAQWFLATQYIADNPDKPPRRLGDFSKQVDPWVEGELLRYRALAENEDTATLESDMAMCTEASEVQGDVIKTIRETY